MLGWSLAIVATHTPPNGAFRGFGAPQVTFAYERQMDRIAQVCGLSPLEVRRRNMLLEGGETATGQTLTVSVGAQQVLDEALAMSDYERRHEAIAAKWSVVNDHVVHPATVKEYCLAGQIVANC